MLKFLNFFRKNNKNKKKYKIIELSDKYYSEYKDSDLKEIYNNINEDNINILKAKILALIKLAFKQSLNIDLFDVQLLAALHLVEGKIIEMKTGEGKTFVAPIAAALYTKLENAPVFIGTSNEYLAKRDYEWLKDIYSLLGISVGYTAEIQPLEAKKRAYNNQIIYASARTFVFDYLRDNLVLNISDIAQRKRNYFIIDEVDSILLDEAKTPLIISDLFSNTTQRDLYKKAIKFIKTLNKNDYDIDEEYNTINLNDNGFIKLEKYFNVSFNNASLRLNELLSIINTCLKAYFLLKKEKDYIIKNNQIVLIDPNTGRLSYEKKYSYGIHQALEAKENLKISNEMSISAYITYPEYIKLFKKISGMTGTACSAKSEFLKLYNLDVVQIPTNKPIMRIDHGSKIYYTKEAKYKALIELITKNYKIKRPMLIGTTSVNESEEVSKLLKKYKIKHNVLNAKNHEKEAEIIAQAGRVGAVTVSTNMAGRGVDIILGGNYKYLCKTNNLDKKQQEKLKSILESEKDYVLSIGGLLVVGVSRYDSKRLDNQLIGRAGRQGDPGESIFFVSLDDELLLPFGLENIKKTVSKFVKNKDKELNLKIVKDAVDLAQKKIEQLNFESRENLFKFSKLISSQREFIYSFRNEILTNKSIKIVYSLITELLGKKDVNASILSKLFKILSINEDINELSLNEIRQKVINTLDKQVSDKIDEFSKRGLLNIFYEVTKTEFLKNLDILWRNHLLFADSLKESIHLRSYAQKDMFLEYEKELHLHLQNLLDEYVLNILFIFINIKINIE